MTGNINDSGNKSAELKKKNLKPLPPGDISVFCLQMSLILKAGIPVYEGLNLLCDEKSSGEGNISSDETDLKINGRLAKVIGKLSAGVEAGEPLFSALEKSAAFPEYMTNMIQVGEMSGRLDSVLESLGDYYEREQYLKVKIRNALMYPVFLFCIMSAVIFLLIIKVFPIFDSLLKSMGGSLSDGAQNITGFVQSLAASRTVMIILLSIAALAVLLFLFSRTAAGKKMFDRLAYAFPMTKKINESVAAARFSGVIAITVSSGLDINIALEMSAKMVDNEILKKKFVKCLAEMEQGVSFTEAIANTKVYKSMYIKFMEIGQKTGNFDTVMKKISDLCETEADNAIGNATAFIEPLLIGILSVVIGAILISVMLPLVRIMSSIA